ncbi:MAG: hypothetical protein QM820_47060 [Minicystis sp.]
MGRPCGICHSLKRAEIEADITAGELSIRAIAQKHGLAGHMCVARHKEHMNLSEAERTAASKAKLDAHEEANKAALQVQATQPLAFFGQEGIDITAGTTTEKIDALVTLANRIINKAMTWDSPTAHQSQLGAIKLAKELIVDAAKLKGELAKTVEVRLIESPEWQRTQAKIIAALRPYPAALESVLQALDDEDAPEPVELAS